MRTSWFPGKLKLGGTKNHSLEQLLCLLICHLFWNMTRFRDFTIGGFGRLTIVHSTAKLRKYNDEDILITKYYW